MLHFLRSATLLSKPRSFFSALLLMSVYMAGCSRQPPAPDVSELTAQLSDESSENRHDAMKEIEQRAETMTDTEAVLAVPALREGLRDTDAKVRYRAAKALSKLREASAPAVPELASVLRDPDPKTRYYAVKALDKIGRPARPALSQLRTALRDESADVQYYAAKAIGNIGAEARDALGELQTLSNSTSDSKVKEAADGAIEKINAIE